MSNEDDKEDENDKDDSDDKDKSDNGDESDNEDDEGNEDDEDDKDTPPPLPIAVPSSMVVPPIKTFPVAPVPKPVATMSMAATWIMESDIMPNPIPNNTASNATSPECHLLPLKAGNATTMGSNRAREQGGGNMHVPVPKTQGCLPKNTGANEAVPLGDGKLSAGADEVPPVPRS